MDTCGPYPAIISPMEMQPRHIGQRIGRASLHLLTFAGALLLSLDAWLTRSWEALSVDEVLYHLRAPLAGTNPTVVFSYITRYFPFVIVSCVVIRVLAGITSRRGAAGKSVATLLTLVLSLGMAAGALLDFADFIGLKDYISMRGEDFIGAHYVDPYTTELTFPERKRNLIYLYLESVELTYADKAHGGAFSENVIPELCQLVEEGECFSGGSRELEGALVLPGTGWTVGAMFGQSSGVPLKLPFYGNNMGIELDSFFPGLATIGNLLQEEGYYQQLLIGSEANFAARREFFREHGDFDIYDYNRAIQEGFIPPDYRVFWGFEDEKLFELARQNLLEMASSDQPFNLTMLTVDTHFEDGYVCRLCQQEHGDNQYANVMSCSSRQVAEFVRWVQAQDFYENTTIVICGDHTTMDKDFCEDVPHTYQRKTLTTIINGACEPHDSSARRSYSTLDLFPTTLAALGVQIQGDRLGIGTNLYGKRPTIVEQYGLDECTAALNRQSEFLNSYSKADVNDDFINRVLASCQINYTTSKRGAPGFVVSGINMLNKDLIIDARMELADDRTGQVSSHPLRIWHENPNNPNVYRLVLRQYVPTYEDLTHLHATAYVTLNGQEERVLATRDWVEGE